MVRRCPTRQETSPSEAGPGNASNQQSDSSQQLGRQSSSPGLTRWGPAPASTASGDDSTAVEHGDDQAASDANEENTVPEQVHQQAPPNHDEGVTPLGGPARERAPPEPGHTCDLTNCTRVVIDGEHIYIEGNRTIIVNTGRAETRVQVMDHDEQPERDPVTVCSHCRGRGIETMIDGVEPTGWNRLRTCSVCRGVGAIIHEQGRAGERRRRHRPSGPRQTPANGATATTAGQDGHRPQYALNLPSAPHARHPLFQTVLDDEESMLASARARREAVRRENRQFRELYEIGMLPDDWRFESPHHTNRYRQEAQNFLGQIPDDPFNGPHRSRHRRQNAWRPSVTGPHGPAHLGLLELMRQHSSR